MAWIDKARVVAKEYRTNCKELQQIIEAETFTFSGNAIGTIKGNKISKPVEIAVEQRLMQERKAYLEKAINAVNYAMEQVLQKPNGADTLNLFNMVYWNRSHTLYGAAFTVGISEATAKRYNRFFLKMLAVAMGYLKLNEK